MRLSGKVALVTGAAGGQGRAVVQRFTREGAAVLAFDRDEAGLAELARAVQAENGAIATLAGDVSCGADVERAVATARARFGKLNVLYNNAAVLWTDRDGPIDRVDEATWDAVMAVNLRGVYLCCHYGIPALLEAGGGVIINVASTAAERGDPWYHAYPASKGALLPFTRSLALHYGPRGIRAVVISPGFIDTPMVERWTTDPEALETLLRSIALRRLGTPEEVASVAAFLASDEASYVTGCVIAVDGAFVK